jgi:hypothetical protein
MSENTALAYSCSPYVRSFGRFSAPTALIEEMLRKRERTSARLVAKECCNFHRTGGRISNVESGSVAHFNRRKTRADHQIGLRGKSAHFCCCIPN